MQYYDLKIYQYGNQYKILYFPKRVNEYSDRPYLHSEYDRDKQAMIGDRFACNVSRSRNAVLGLGLCNPWEYFITATLDKRKYDRFNLSAWRSDFSQWIRNQRRLHGYDFKYVLIPEQHADGAWHMHGLVSGVPWNDLEKFKYKVHPLDLVLGGYRYYPAMTEKFGFNSFGKVKSQAAASRYVLKYIAKGLGESDIDRGTHLYYASQKLNRPECIIEGQSTSFLGTPDFQNDYLASSWIDKDELDRISEYIL